MTTFQVDDSDSQAPAVWRCDGCDRVHVRAKSTLLTFTTAEFAAFTETVNDCFWREALAGSSADCGPKLGLLPPSPLR